MTDEELSISDVTLIARLRKADEYEPLGHDGWEAADRIEQLVATNEALTEQLAAARQDAKEAETYAWKLEEELRDTQDRANAFATKEYYTEMRAERAEAKLAKAVEALLWCSGSADFNEGGVAREGWLKVCAPLLKGESHE